MDRNEKFRRWLRTTGLTHREVEDKYGISKTTVSRIVKDQARWRDEDSEVEATIVKALGTTRGWWEDDSAGLPMPVAGVEGAYYLDRAQINVLSSAEKLAELAGEEGGSLRLAQQRLFGVVTAGFDVLKPEEPDGGSRPAGGRRRPGAAG